MKSRSLTKNLLAALAFGWALFPTNVHAQGWNVMVSMQPFPSPYLGDWEHNPTIGSLTITNNTTTPTDVLIYLTIARANGSMLATGNSNPVSVPPGAPVQINSDRFIDWSTVTYDAGSRDQAIQTGRLPEGEYNACITLKDMSGPILVSNVCAPFTIVYPSPPSLFFPMDGDSLDSMYPIFTWTPVNVPPAYQLHYVLRIVEILSGQTPHQALLANIVQFENDNLLTTNIQYPISALPLEPGKTYAWHVQAVDQNGFPPSANQGRSEIWMFVTKDVLGQTPPTAPLTIEIAPSANGLFSDFESSSFESVAQRLEPFNTTGGTVALPMSTTTGPTIFERVIIKAAERGIYIDTQKKSIAIKGGWTKSGRTYEILFTAVWGTRNDPRDKTLTVKGPLLSRLMPDVFSGLTEEYLIFSGADFDLKHADLPDSVDGFFGTEDEVELKPGVNFLGKFDLHRTPNLTNLMTMLGVEEPHVKLKGHISREVNWVFSTGDSLTREKTVEMALGASIPLTRSLVSWMPEADAELEIGWERKRTNTPHGPDSIEYKLAPKLTLQGKVTFPFLRNAVRLNDTVEVKGSIALEFESLGAPDWVATFEVDDVINFPKFENVFKFHDPKLEWNISKKSVKLEGEFDFGRYEKVGTIEVAYGKKDTTTRRPGGPDTTGATPTNTPPAVPAKTNLAAMMNPERPEPLSGGKPPKTWEAKVTAKFNQSALHAFRITELIRTALNLGENLLGDVQDIREVNEFSPALRNSAPPPNYAPPPVPDFLDNFPALSELGMSFRPGNLGSMVVRAKTQYQNSSTEIIAARAESATKKGFIFGLKPQNWSIQNYFPDFSMPGLDNLTLSNVAIVFSNIEGMIPSTELTDEEFEFYSSAYGSDDFTVVIKPGLNLIATIPGDNLGSGGPLVPIMEKLGVERGTLLLQGSLGRRLQDIYLLAVFPSMQPPGAPGWFRSGEMAVELTGLPSIGLVGALTVTIEDDDVTFLLKTKAGRDGLVLSGGMVSLDGWNSPFGIEWLTLNRVMMLLGVTPTGSVQLGFNADMVVGTKDIDVAVLVALNVATGVPTNAMFDGESEEGFGLSDLVTLQSQIAAARTGGAGPEPLSLENMPTLDIKRAKLKFAPKDSPELGIERGLAIGGRLLLRADASSPPRMLADALFDVGDNGIIARGEIGRFELGPVKMDEAKIDLTMTREEQYFLIAGHADLGFMKSDLDISFTKTSMLFDASGKIFNLFEADLYAHGQIDFTNPKFEVRAKMKNDFNEQMTQLFDEELPPIVTSNRTKAKAAADAAEKELDNAEKARNAAFKKWEDTPLLPRDPKVAAREKLTQKTADVAKKRSINIAKQAEFKKWDLAKKALDQQQSGGERVIVVQRGEFEADLGSLVAGGVKQLEMDVKIRGKEKHLSLSGWSFKDIRKSLRAGVQQIVQNLVEP